MDKTKRTEEIDTKIVMEDKLLEQLGKDLRDDFKKISKEAFDEAMDEKLKALNKKIDSVQQVVDYARTEVDEIGRDFSDLKVTQSEQTTAIREMIVGLSKQSKTIVQKITSSVETTVDDIAQTVGESVQPAVEDTLNQFVENNAKKMKPKQKKRFRLPFFTKN